MTCSSTIREGHDHGLVWTPCGLVKAKTLVLTLLSIEVFTDVINTLFTYYFVAKNTYHAGIWTQLGLTTICTAIFVGLWIEIWLTDKPYRRAMISWSAVLFLLGFRDTGLFVLHYIHLYKKNYPHQHIRIQNDTDIGICVQTKKAGILDLL